MVKVIGCIPAKLESRRLPRKALEDVHGKSLLHRLVERMQNLSSMIDEVCLCTVKNENNMTLVQKAEEWSIPYNRGPELDVLANYIAATEKAGGDHFLRITGDNIFTDPYYIDEMTRLHIEHGAGYSRVDGLPGGMTAEAMSLEAAKSLHERMSEDIRNSTEYLTLYSYDPENLKVLVLDAAPKYARPNYSVTVDTPADLELVRKIWAAFPDEKFGPDIDQIIGWLDAHPQERIEVDETAMVRLPGDKVMSFTDFAADLARRKEKAQVRLIAA